MKRTLPLLLIVIFGTLFAVLLLNPVPPQSQSLGLLPQLALTTKAGKPVVLPTLGRPAIVNVFASWCVPCAAEMPLLLQLSKSVPIYGVAYKDQPQALDIYLKRYGNPFTALGMDDGRIATQLGITGVPESYLVDVQGRIVRHMPGMLDAQRLADWQAEIATWR